MTSLASDSVSSCVASARRLRGIHWWLLLAVLATLGLGLIATSNSSPPPSRTDNAFSEEQLDSKLQIAADNALANQKSEGTIVIIDPQTGRIRAVANSKLAFEEMFSPGSTIKPFVTLSALQTGLIDDHFRLSCPGGYSKKEFYSACSHPKDLPSLNASDAIAYSCNHFFGRLGERLDARKTNALLSDFGFGKLTGVGDSEECAGRVSNKDWKPQDAMGDGEHLLVTPIQLLNAYSALVNGGHLFQPWRANESASVQEHKQVNVEPSYRSLIIQGMRDAVRFGTAHDSQLDSLPLYIFGKTGTSTERKGFRTQGWFVGFASVAEDNQNFTSRPEDIRLGVVVFLKRAHGSQAATVSRSIFEEFAKTPDTVGITETGSAPSNNSPTISVHLVNENRTLNLPLEEYVAHVVAVEGALEDEPEALKALAVSSRTYALKNLHRHEQDGYDFCSTTHCQRFTSTSDIPKIVRDAVGQTTSQTIQDDKGNTIDAYFSASCGGATANINDLWGVKAPAYLVGVTDDYCTSMPHARWKDVISSEKLLHALQQDPRTDVGQHLQDIRVARRDSSGRAQTLILKGDVSRVISGWDFKIIIGRSLGWEYIKSSRFDVKKSASNYIFIGSGFGHGLGLCQEGAHVMARRGANYQQILAKYFPGTSISGTKTGFVADLIWQEVRNKTERHSDSFRVLANENFRVTYPGALSSKDADKLLRVLESNRTDLLRHVANSGFRITIPTINVVVNDTTGNFVGRTGQPAWAAAATKGNIIELQPLFQLQRRGILETTIRHELAHAVIESLSRSQTPRWLEEGFALYLAGEGPRLVRLTSSKAGTFPATDRAFESARSKEEMRAAYASAYEAVNKMIAKDGEPAVWRRIAGY